MFTDPPSPPNNITVVVTQTTLTIGWTPPTFSSRCIVITSYILNSNITNTTTAADTTSVDFPLAGLSPGIYYVSVAAVDTANRTGSYSDEIFFELKGIISYMI